MTSREFGPYAMALARVIYSRIFSGHQTLDRTGLEHEGWAYLIFQVFSSEKCLPWSLNDGLSAVLDALEVSDVGSINIFDSVS